MLRRARHEFRIDRLERRRSTFDETDKFQAHRRDLDENGRVRLDIAPFAEQTMVLKNSNGALSSGAVVGASMLMVERATIWPLPSSPKVIEAAEHLALPPVRLQTICACSPLRDEPTVNSATPRNCTFQCCAAVISHDGAVRLNW